MTWSPPVQKRPSVLQLHRLTCTYRCNLPHTRFSGYSAQKSTEHGARDKDERGILPGSLHRQCNLLPISQNLLLFTCLQRPRRRRSLPINTHARTPCAPLDIGAIASGVGAVSVDVRYRGTDTLASVLLNSALQGDTRWRGGLSYGAADGLAGEIILFTYFENQKNSGTSSDV